MNRWPVGTRTADMQQTVPGLHVTWEGNVVPRTGGLHRFRLYGSSYFKVFVDGTRGARPLAAELERLVPQFRRDACRRAAAQAAHRVGAGSAATSRSCTTIRVPEPDRHSLTLSSDFGARRRLLLRPRQQHGRRDRRLPRAHRQGADMPQMGVRLLAEPPALRDAGPAARRARTNIASGGSRSTTSCRTGSTGRRTSGAASASTRRASPIRRPWSTTCTRMART